ncbi:hypothetical protein ACJDU8_21655 [Clostridium sp. WILCCON 0269]|uniref:Uncharacterized protein n=1 Tax=Candidatus Clostridium eludens TaxID=3381663 RepID=A0ABW8SQE6_9CLOT
MYERAKLALKLEPIIQEKTKKNQSGLKGNQYTGAVCQKSDKDQKPIDAKKELAQIAGVSHDTTYKVNGN